MHWFLTYTNQDTLQIYGDSNARIGGCVNYIEGVGDNVKPRKTINFCTNTRPLYKFQYLSP